MKKYNFSLIFFIGWVSFMTGKCMEDMGKFQPAFTVTWREPLIFVVLCAFCFGLGWSAKKEHDEK